MSDESHPYGHHREAARRLVLSIDVPPEHVERAVEIALEILAVEELCTGGANWLAIARVLDCEEADARALFKLAGAGAAARTGVEHERAGRSITSLSPREQVAVAQGVQQGIEATVALQRLLRRARD